MSYMRKLWMAIWHAGDYTEQLREIDRMRAEAIGMLEACARVCDVRARIAEETGLCNPDGFQLQRLARLEAYRDEAKACAAAIRAMEKP